MRFFSFANIVKLLCAVFYLQKNLIQSCGSHCTQIQFIFKIKQNKYEYEKNKKANFVF